jgi:acetylornithine deacetylase/succinyl-diaminopimelate desuccinylase-like protein
MVGVRRYFESNSERFILEWKKFLGFRSISADPAYHHECVKCADWVRDHISNLGFHAEVWKTATKPLVFAERKGNPSKASVLFYGHYDVQPVDPLELWTSEPFEATLRDGRLYARGAQDNKGQVFFFLKALEALIAEGADLPTIKILIEGEEECGSEAMQSGLKGWGERLQADILMVADTGMLVPGVPTITMGLRGIVECEVRVYGPRMDIHSGVYGGVVLNPIQALTRMLASLHNADGSIAVPGFYDGVQEPTAEEKALVADSPINLKQLEEFLGVSLAGGEKRFSALERRGLRPTLELNGIGGGYQGAGGKTVIPSFAMAKISMRLVSGQQPQKTLSTVVKYLEQIAPEGVRVEVGDFRVGGAAFRLPAQSNVLQIARRAIKSEFNVEPHCLWEGASVPIIPALAEASGAEPLLVGFGMEEDKIHSPDESFSLRQFEEGYRYVTAFFKVI